MASATTSGLFQFDVSVAAESVISFPPFVIMPSILLLKTRLWDIPDTLRIEYRGKVVLLDPGGRQETD